MDSLTMKISEIKTNLIDINIKAIKKCKAKPIKNYSNNENLDTIKNYNYHVKLMKRIKKYINLSKHSEIILKVDKDRFEKIVYIVVKIDKKILDIGIPVQIKIVTGNDCNVNMDCTYYEKNDNGYIYINDFRSAIPNKGYGRILLKNLDNIVNLINKSLITDNHNEISMVKGLLIPNENIISKTDLKNMYIRYGFRLEGKNNIMKSIENIVKSTI